MAISAHKMGGPSGVGALWIHPQAPLESQITGGRQERKRRAGTQNSLGLYGLRLALEDWMLNGDNYRRRMKELRDVAIARLKKIEGLHIHGSVDSSDDYSLVNTLNFHVEGCPEESLLLALDLDGFCVSSGSACNSGSLKPSHVLRAMGYSDEVALSSLRLSLSVETGLEEVQAFVQSVEEKVIQIRKARILARELVPDLEVIHGN